MMLTNLLADILIVTITVFQNEIRILCPISGSYDSRKRHEMRHISNLAIVHPHMALIMNVFPMSFPVKAGIDSTFYSYFIPNLFHIIFVFVLAYSVM
jgi:hypothetical protein